MAYTYTFALLSGNVPASYLDTNFSEACQRSNNLSDLANASTARTNLGLGDMATQSAASVAITGGTLSGVTISGSTITTPTITVKDANFSLLASADVTKTAKFDLSALSTATTRTLSVQDVNGTIYVTGGTDVAVADGGTGASTASTARANLVIADGNNNASRIILNGDFAIDQPNAGAEIAFAGSSIYAFDGCQLIGSGAGRFKVKSQSSTVLYGSSCLATTSALFTVTTAAASPGSTDYYAATFKIEGKRWARLKYGSSGAQNSVLRFRAQSSASITLTGSYRNNATNRSYPFSVALAANTPTDILISIPGDTTGTWLTDTGIGCYLTISLGVGSSFGNTANAWAAGNYVGVAGAGLMATLGATLEITGLDIIPGAVAPAVYVPPDPALELIRAMREYEKSFPQGTAPAQNLGAANSGAYRQVTAKAGAVGSGVFVPFQVRKRNPSSILTFFNPNAANGQARDQNIGADCSSMTGTSTDTGFYSSFIGNAATAVGDLIDVAWVADDRL